VEPLNKIDFGETGKVFMVDDQGRYLNYHNPELFFNNQATVFQEFGRDFGRRILTEETGLVEVDNRLIAFQKLPELNTSVLFTQSLSDLTNGLDEVHRRLVIVALGLLVTAIVMNLLITRTISRPLSGLVAGARELAGGNLTNPVQLASNDEVALVAAAFEEMRQGLQQIIGKVKEMAVSLTRACQEIESRSKKSADRMADLRDVSHEMAGGAAASFRTVNRTLELLDQINQAIYTADANGDTVGKMAEEARKVSNAGAQEITMITTTVNNIRDTVRELAP